MVGAFKLFKPNEENQSIMEFRAKESNMYMNETADNHLLISPIDAPCMTITYKDFKGEFHTIEGVLFAFLSDYKTEGS